MALKASQGRDKQKMYIHIFYFYLKKAFQDKENKEKHQPAFPFLKRTEKEILSCERGNLEYKFLLLYTEHTVYLHCLFLSVSLSHTHTVQSLRAGQGERPDYSRWVLCSWGSAKRWEEGEDKQTVCLLSDYSIQSVCICLCVYFSTACGCWHVQPNKVN